MGIVQACCNYLDYQLCLENYIGIWKFADIYFCPNVMLKACVFSLYHFERMVCVSEEFLGLSLQQLDIIKKDNLNVK